MQKRPAPRISAALKQIGAWVLDQPVPPPLEGQCCDRLRPTQIQRELLHSLEASGVDISRLVDWRWDARQGHARGWLWQAGALQRFRWWRQSGQLSLHEHHATARTALKPSVQGVGAAFLPLIAIACRVAAIDQHP